MHRRSVALLYLDDITPDLNTIVLYYHGNSYLSRIRDINWFSGSSPPKTLPRNIIGGCGTVMTLCEYRQWAIMEMDGEEGRVARMERMQVAK